MQRDTCIVNLDNILKKKEYLFSNSIDLYKFNFDFLNQSFCKSARELEKIFSLDCSYDSKYTPDDINDFSKSMRIILENYFRIDSLNEIWPWNNVLKKMSKCIYILILWEYLCKNKEIFERSYKVIILSSKYKQIFNIEGIMYFDDILNINKNQLYSFFNNIVNKLLYNEKFDYYYQTIIIKLLKNINKSYPFNLTITKNELYHFICYLKTNNIIAKISAESENYVKVVYSKNNFKDVVYTNYFEPSKDSVFIRGILIL